MAHTYTEIINSLLQILHMERDVENVTNQFNAKQPCEKVSFTYRLLEDRGLLPDCEEKSVKCSVSAADRRTRGNQAFCRKQDADALNFYSDSVRLSLPNSPELSLAYANRSAVLFKCEKYDLCLLDIDRAFDINYPDNLKHKLYLRKGNCLQKMGRYSEAKESFQNARDYLVKSEVTSEQRSSLEKSLKKSIDECSQVDQRNDISSVKIFPLPELPSRNSLIPNASDKIRLNSSSEMGRHLTATQDIEPGEILATEKAYASILLPEFYLSHCSNCFVRNLAMIPCEKCALLMFCNEKCLEDSMARYHATECDIMPYLLALDVSKMELLTVRILMIATNQGNDLSLLLEDRIFGSPLPYPVPSDLLDIGEIYDSESYEAVHMLEENFCKRSPSDLFQRSGIAAILLHVVECSSFFGNALLNSTSEEEPDLVKFTSALLLKYLCIVLCNAHEVSELIKDDSKLLSKLGHRNMEIGAALYPLLSLTNHSCDPNVVRHSYHDSVVLRAIQPIAKDEQIFDNYGHHYAVHDLNSRQHMLQLQYFFTCGCSACRHNWPTYEKLPSKSPRYLPIKVPFRELKEYSKNFQKILNDIMDLKLDGVLERLYQYLTLLHKSVQRPWKEYSECQEAIKECLAYQGNNYVPSKDATIILAIKD